MTMEEPKSPSPMRLFGLRYLFLGCFLLLLSYAVFDRTLPVEIKSVQVVNEPVPGGYVIVKVVLDRNKTCYTKTERFLFDSAGVRFSLGTSEYQMPGTEGDDQYSVHIPIDVDATPGVGTIRFINIWVCNYTHIIWPLIRVRDVPVTISVFPN